MFKWTLFRRIAASNRKMFLIITTVLCVLVAVIMNVFKPETMAKMAQVNQDAAINPLGDISTLLAFLANQYFGMFALILGIIYVVITGNKLVAAQVDRGSMGYHLATPTSRLEVTGTSTIYLLGSLAFMLACQFGVGCAAAAVAQPGELDVATYFNLTVGFYLLMVALSGIVFAASCLFNRSSYAVAAGAGVLIFFFVTDLLSGMSSSLSSLKNVTLITLYDSIAIVNGGSFAAGLIPLTTLGLICYAAGIVTFQWKDLPL
ncbi:hypothetical protein [Paenibacillus illinoisensis]|uniref:hypothetical protein n=1 Tax=Paenibacillus illinoisensis TaxID=59845 RepID=UPI003D9650F7